MLLLFIIMSSTYESPKEKIYSIRTVREGRKKYLILHFSFAAASGIATAAAAMGYFFSSTLYYLKSEENEWSKA